MQSNETAAIINTLSTATPMNVIGGMVSLTKVMTLLALGVGIVAVILAIMRKTSAGPRSSLLNALGWVGLGAGIAGAAYAALNTYIAANAMHEYRFVILLPSFIEAAYALVIGLIALAIATWGNALGQCRRQAIGQQKSPERTPGFSF